MVKDPGKRKTALWSEQRPRDLPTTISAMGYQLLLDASSEMGWFPPSKASFLIGKNR